MAENKKRIPISKKIRFEVFKRDSFTCQYCGEKAPNVILNVDHIHPVKEGGTNDIMNLITACFGCNSGKKARKLSDNSVIEKQFNQIEVLNEKRLQLEMLIQWREEVSSIKSKTLEYVLLEITRHIPNKYSLTDPYKKKIEIAIDKFGVDIILKSIDISLSKYLLDISDKNSVVTYVEKIPGIAYYESLSPLESKIKLVVNLIHKVFYNVEKWQIDQLVSQYLNTLKTYWDYNDENLISDLSNEVIPLIDKCNDYYSFRNSIQNWIHEIQNQQ